MQIIRQEFIDRVEEINKYYRLLENIENGVNLYIAGREVSFETGMSSSLKSGAILLLYNLVESTISKCLKGIHLNHIDDGLNYFELSDNIQLVLLKYHYKASVENTDIKNLINQLQHLLNNRIIIISSDKEWRNFFDNQFSGNLDSQEIRAIADKYGIEFDLKSEEVKKVEEMRNKLAHGELSFEEACRDFSIQYIKKLREKTIVFLSEFISAVEKYIIEKKYKR
jgi:hypothetical protein